MTQPTIEQIISLKRAGNTWDTIGAIFGVTAESVRMRIRKKGIKIDPVLRECLMCGRSINSRKLTDKYCVKPAKCGMVASSKAKNARLKKSNQVKRICLCGCGTEMTCSKNKYYVNKKHKDKAKKLIDKCIPFFGDRSLFILQELALQNRASRKRANKRYTNVKDGPNGEDFRTKRLRNFNGRKEK